MRCPVCRHKLSDTLTHLRAMPECRRKLYDMDRVLIIDGHEILAGSVHCEQSVGTRLWWVKGLNVNGRPIPLRSFSTKAVADIFIERQQAEYAKRGGNPDEVCCPRIPQRPATKPNDREPRIAVRELAAIPRRRGFPTVEMQEDDLAEP